MKLTIDLAPLDADSREVLVAAWAEIFRRELLAARESASAPLTNRKAGSTPPGLEEELSPYV
jgi:hypothetical protein